MKRVLLIFILICSFSEMAFSQTYSRSSITPIFIQYNTGPDYTTAANNVIIPDNFDYNYFGSNLLRIDADMISPNEIKIGNIIENLRKELAALDNKPINLDYLIQRKKIKKEKKRIKNEISYYEKQLKIEDSLHRIGILDELRKQRVPNKILSAILIDENTNAMSLEKLSKRAEYNASDADFLRAKNSEAKMSAIRDMGVSLLSNVYILFFDTRQVLATDNNKNSKEDILLQKGNVFLYKIDIDTLIKTGQFDGLVFTEPDNFKYNSFQNFAFPLKFITEKQFIGSLVKDSFNHIYANDISINELLDDALHQVTEAHKRFQIKSTIFKSQPISAKIGRKESIKFDELFKVTENILRKNSEITQKRIGWIRAKKVVDNRKNAEGKTEPSIFYKTGSKKVEKGMTLTKVKEEGFLIGVEYGIPLTNNLKWPPSIKSDNIMAGPHFILDFVPHSKPVGLRSGLSFGGFLKLRPDKVFISGIPVPSNILNFEGTYIYADLNIQKVIQSNHIELTPAIGGYISVLSIDKYFSYGVEKKIEENDDLKGLSNVQAGVFAGLRFGYNLGKYSQINFGYKAGFQLYSELKCDKKGEVTYNSYGPITMKFKQPNAFSLGIRFMGF